MWEVLQGELKIKKGPINGKSAVLLEWLIRHEFVRYVCPQDDPCDLARWISKSVKFTKAN